jgi:hypothetical protein
MHVLEKIYTKLFGKQCTTNKIAWTNLQPECVKRKVFAFFYPNVSEDGTRAIYKRLLSNAKNTMLDFFGVSMSRAITIRCNRSIVNLNGLYVIQTMLWVYTR